MSREGRYLRKFITSEARHLWLFKLQGLDQACAPDLPIDVDINALSCEKLREVACRSVRVYDAMIKGQSEETPVPYQLQQTIVPAYPSEIPFGGKITIDHVKIAPGGRYLFMCWTHDKKGRSMDRCAFKFCIHDLEASGQLVWSFIPTTHRAYIEGTQEIFNYDFEICRDGSIILALITRYTEDIGVDSRFFLTFAS